MPTPENPLPTGERYRRETLRMPNGDEVSFSPERGGIITSLKLSGQELFYLDEETFSNPDVSVKGGDPILFPNAGSLQDLPEGSPFQNLKQHGFARNSDRWQAEIGENEFREKLLADDDTREVYPYNFELVVGGEFMEDGSFTITQSVTNLEPKESLPLAMGFHPYFRVPHDKKTEIGFDFAGAEGVQKEMGDWQTEHKAIFLDNPQVENPEAPLRIVLPEVGTLVMDVSPNYQKIWVWHLPGKDFVCIEPVMRDPGGLVNDPELVAPGTTFTGKINMRLEV